MKPIAPLKPLRTVLLAGASGLVGSMLLKRLLADPTVGAVHVVARRPLAETHQKLTLHCVDFKSLPLLPSIDEAYLALGTTIKKAGSRSAFRAVDLHANLAVGMAAISAGAGRIGLVSAYQANTNSSLFYTRVKGELEEVLAKLSPQTLVIARPSFLLGDRSFLGQSPRRGEKLGIYLSKLMSQLLPENYRPVQAQQVADALLDAVPNESGRIVLVSADFKKYAEQ